MRIPPPDIKYGSVELSQFINRVMWSGKKTTAQRIVYKALDMVEQEANRPGLEVFQQALRNATPLLEVKSRRVGGRHLSGADGSQADAADGAVDALDHHGGAAAGQQAYARKPRYSAAGSGAQSGSGGAAQRRGAPNGGGEPRFRSLSLVV